MGEQEGDRTALTLSRVFDAPRERVWNAWTDPELVKGWWGPKGFTSPAGMIDLRVGGSYLFCMRSPEGKEYWSTGKYLEIEPPRRLVCTDSFADERGNVVPASYHGMESDFPLELQVTVTFEEEDGKTLMNLSHVGFPAGQVAEEAATGWSESFDKLEQLVSQ